MSDRHGAGPDRPAGMIAALYELLAEQLAERGIDPAARVAGRQAELPGDTAGT